MLLLAGAAVLLPSAAEQVSAQPAAVSSQPFTPPEAPLELTRTVWRGLSDGKEIMVRRRYEVRFSRLADGFRLDGRLLDAAVEAPPMLAPLAELERKRSDEGLFPILLDAAGRIRENGSDEQGPSAQNEEAREQALRLLSSSSQSPAQQQASRAFLTQIASQRAGAAWPVDLFNPASLEQHQRRRIALPDGQEGNVDVSIIVSKRLPEGLPQSVERTVTSVLGGTSRTSREQWTLAPVDSGIR